MPSLVSGCSSGLAGKNGTSPARRMNKAGRRKGKLGGPGASSDTKDSWYCDEIEQNSKNIIAWGWPKVNKTPPIGYSVNDRCCQYHKTHRYQVL